MSLEGQRGTFRTIEIARGLAAFSVVLAHIPLGGILPGGPGVEFFFVLSGFIMGHLHLADLSDGRKIPSFLWKRICRIYPLYWLALLSVLYIFGSHPDVTWLRILEWTALAPTLRNNSILLSAWTLQHEILFYLMLAVGMIPRIGRPIFWSWIAATVLLLFYTPPYIAALQAQPGFFFLFNQFNCEFAIGFVAGGFAGRVLRLPVGVWLALMAGAVGGLVWRWSVDAWGYVYGPPFARLIYGACFATIILGLVKIETVGLWRPGRWAQVVGGISYPLYLCNMPVAIYLQVYVWDHHAAAPDIVRITYLIAVLAAAILLYYGFDKPVVRALRRLGDAGGNARKRHGTTGHEGASSAVPDNAMHLRH